MTTEHKNISKMLVACGLKVTPQRIAVLDAVCSLKNHPTSDQVAMFIRSHYPHISLATVYKTLEVFVEKGLVRKVETGRDVMRFDAMMDHHHHHLYALNSDQIENYFDEDLDALLQEYFSKKNIPGFSIQEFRVQILGHFNQ